MVNLSKVCVIPQGGLDTKTENYYKVKDYYTRKKNAQTGIRLWSSFSGIKAQEGMLSRFVNRLIGQDKRCKNTIEGVFWGKENPKKAAKHINLYRQIGDIGMNIISSSAAGAAAIASSGDALARAIAAGAFTKIAVKCADRATNKIKGDTFNKEKVIQDGITGSVIGILPHAHGMTEYIETILSGKTLKNAVHKIFHTNNLTINQQRT